MRSGNTCFNKEPVMPAEPTKAVQIFFSYAHEDEPLRKELEKQLSFLKWQGLISGWNDRDIKAGEEWAHEIDRHLNSAHIILLLVSPDFMASDYCYSIEMERALARHKAGKAQVIPIILRPVFWKDAPFGKLRVLPTDTKPVTSWPNRDEAFLDIATGIRKIVQELLKPSSPAISQKTRGEWLHTGDISGSPPLTGEKVRRA
jgi:TIR domain